jgi:hypothetical protein
MEETKEISFEKWLMRQQLASKVFYRERASKER